MLPRHYDGKCYLCRAAYYGRDNTCPKCGTKDPYAKQEKHPMVEHTGLPVAGYVPQSDDKVSLVNENKVLEEKVLRQIDKMKRDNTAHEANGQKPPYDARMMAIATTGVQEAFMWLNRAVFQPKRLEFSDDHGPAD